MACQMGSFETQEMKKVFEEGLGNYSYFGG